MNKEPTSTNLKNAIIVHGMPSKREDRIAKLLGVKASKFHWLGWLAKRLKENGYEVWSPEMPRPYAPDWEVWSKQVEKAKIGPKTILVGHSCGAGFWVKYLSLNKDLKPAKVILVAPWLDLDGDETDGFFKDFKIDSNLTNRTNVVVFNSDNDMGNVLKSVATIREALPAVEYKEFHKYGHFTIFTMKTAKFPELLEECLK